MSKWDLILDYCKKLGLVKSTAIASEAVAFSDKYFKKIDSDRFNNDENDIIAKTDGEQDLIRCGEYLVILARSVHYCSACCTFSNMLSTKVITSEECDNCPISKYDIRCTEEGSFVKRFISAVREETGLTKELSDMDNIDVFKEVNP